MSRSYVASNAELASAGTVTLSSAELDFGQYTILRAVRTLAKSLAAVPGRKILIFLSAGFEVTADIMTDLTAAIDACNKANVAVYPIDVRGLAAPTTGELLPSAEPVPSRSESTQVRLASLNYTGASPLVIVRPVAFFQAGGKPGGGGAPRPHGGGTGSKPPTTGSRPPAPRPMPPTTYQNPMNRRPSILPPFPQSAVTNQQVFYALAQPPADSLSRILTTCLAECRRLPRNRTNITYWDIPPPTRRKAVATP